MKNFLKITLVIIISLIGVFSINLGADISAPSAYAENEISEAKILYNPTLVAANDTLMFVYDEYKGVIKVYNKTTNALSQVVYEEDNTKYINLENVSKMEVCNNYLFVLSGTETKTISAYYIPSLSTTSTSVSSISSIDKGALSKVFDFSAYHYSEDCIYLMAAAFDETEHTNKFYILNFGINIEPTNSAFASTIAEFETNLENQTQISSLLLTPNTTENYLTLVLSMGNKIYYFNFKPAEQAEFSQSTSQILNISANVLNLSRISENATTYLVVATQSGFNLYEENILGGYSLNFVSATPYQIGETWGFGTNGANLFASNPADKKIVVFSLTEATPKALNGETLLENGELFTTAILPQNLEFFRVNNSQAALTSSPYSKEALLNLNQNDIVVRVARVHFGNNELLEDYYCLSVGSSQNYYGYVKSSYLTKINATSGPKSKIYVNSGSNIYNLPSAFIDNSGTIQNTKTTTNQIQEVTLLNSGVYGLNLHGSFYLIETKKHTIGFMEADREYVVSGAKRLVKNNASTIKETIVYDSDDGNGEIIDTLSEGARVRIEENQKTNVKYVKITYNDNAGVERTGYVLSENLKTDAWSVLRIIGLVLVGLNVVFLIVLLVVKKRINHD